VQTPRHLRLLVRRHPPARHGVLRRRLTEVVVIVGVVDVIGTVLMWTFEDDARPGEIHNLWDAFFFSTVQLLTVSSQMPNPVTTGGRIVDIFLELTAICFVTGIAGTFASFFLEADDEEPVAQRESRR
jgi:hypothetical protein